jgi:type I restriction enzyme M protein
VERDRFEADLNAASKRARLNLPTPIKKAIFAALGERDPRAAICTNSKGQPEPDSELRDSENIPLPAGTFLPPTLIKFIPPWGASIGKETSRGWLPELNER